MKLLKEYIQAIPKAELHCHLDGSLRISTILELAENQGVRLPANNEKDLADLLCGHDKINNLEEYLQRFEITLSVMQTAASLQLFLPQFDPHSLKIPVGYQYWCRIYHLYRLI